MEKRRYKHMTYDDVYRIISIYANEMLPHFADAWSRFPRGGNAAMIANYLNDRAYNYEKISMDITNDMINAATEIIVRCE